MDPKRALQRIRGPECSVLFVAVNTIHFTQQALFFLENMDIIKNLCEEFSVSSLPPGYQLVYEEGGFNVIKSHDGYY